MTTRVGRSTSHGSGHRSPATLPIPGTLPLERPRQDLAALEIELTDAEFEAPFWFATPSQRNVSPDRNGCGLYTVRYSQPPSKLQAASWAQQEFPQWADLVRRAGRLRREMETALSSNRWVRWGDSARSMRRGAT